MTRSLLSSEKEEGESAFYAEHMRSVGPSSIKTHGLPIGTVMIRLWYRHTGRGSVS